MALQHLVFKLWPIFYLLPWASSQLKRPNCESTCGNVTITYPFGMNDSECYDNNEWFRIKCVQDKPYLEKIGHLEVMRIEQDSCRVWIKNPVHNWNRSNSDSSGSVGDDHHIDMRGSPFTYSRDNVFLGVGCNTQAVLQSANGSGDVGGCVSICDMADHKEAAHVSGIRGCRGRYCCTTSLPGSLWEFRPRIEGIGNTSYSSGDWNYAMIIAEDEGDYDWGRRNVSEVKEWDSVPAVLEYSNCSEPDISSSGTLNSGSKRHCVCPTDGRRNSGSKSQGLSVIGVVFSSLVSIVFLVGVWIQIKIFRKSRINKRKEKYFKQNGGLLLQRSLHGDASFDKTKLFSSKDLEKATDRFSVNRVLGKGGQGTVYKGMLSNGQIVAVKKLRFQGNVEEFINEVVILSQINHRNVVKLLGFCLETQVPLLVYEFIPNGNLSEHLHEPNEEFSMTWDTRLRIATEVAGALFYLHSAASRPIFHRDIKSTNILLDDKFRAKVADFGASRMVSMENTHITTKVLGTFGYLDPEYFHTSQFTEKSDVYSFGVVLVELLTGQAPISTSSSGGRPAEAQSLASYFITCMEQDRRYDILDKRIIMEGLKEEIDVVANLARRCLNMNGKKRPSMRDVTLELEGIQKLKRSSSLALQNYEETDFVGSFESCPAWSTTAYNASSGSPLNTQPSSSTTMTQRFL